MLALPPILASSDINALALEIARGRNEWVQTLGAQSEAIHDAVDKASVDLGRQSAVGDGNPMTSWHDDKLTVADMVDSVIRGSMGASDYLVALFIGSDQEYSEALLLAKARIASRSQGISYRS